MTNDVTNQFKVRLITFWLTTKPSIPFVKTFGIAFLKKLFNTKTDYKDNKTICNLQKITEFFNLIQNI